MSYNEIDNLKSKLFRVLGKGIPYIIAGGIFFSFCLWIHIKGANAFTRIVIIPFLLCGFCIILDGIFNLLRGINVIKEINIIKTGAFYDRNEFKQKDQKYKKLVTLSKKLYILSFLLYWFGFLIVYDYLAIQNWAEDGAMLFFFSLIFWAVGIYLAVVSFKNKK